MDVAKETSPDRDALYKVAYDEAVRALSEQLTLIDSFRARGGLLLSVAAITTSFLSAGALLDGSLNAPSWVALSAFVATAVLLLAILSPRPRRVAAKPDEVITDWIEGAGMTSLDALYRDLCLEIQQSNDETWRELSRLATCSQVASCLLAFEIVCWILAIASMP